MPFHEDIVCCYLHPITKYGYPPPAADTLKYLEEMQTLGFQTVELEGIRREHLLKVYEMRYQIKEKLVQLQLSVPYFCAVLPGLSSPDEQERAVNLRLFEKGCEIAQLLGARGVLDNGPLPPYQFPSEIPVVRHYGEAALQAARFPADLDWPLYWQALTDTYRAGCDIAALYGLSYHLHPCLGTLTANTDAYLCFRDAVDRDNLRFNLDTANQFFLKDNLTLALHRLGDNIDYIHVSDNSGQRVEHLEIGRGRIAWPSFLETLARIGFKGQIGIDIGGAESAVDDLDKAYVDAATWIDEKWFKGSGQLK